jgi:hypothetical protein
MLLVGEEKWEERAGWPDSTMEGIVIMRMVWG